jgi:hypothetical protein
MKKTRSKKTKAKSVAATRGRNNAGMPAEIDFSRGTRGQFYRHNARLNVPVYLDADVQAYLGAIAAKRGIPLSVLTNDLLKKEIAILQTLDAHTIAADQS